MAKIFTKEKLALLQFGPNGYSYGQLLPFVPRLARESRPVIFRSLLILFALAMPATAMAGSYRVIFGGAITEIDSGAPDSFSIGERVLGTYEFSAEPEWSFSANVTENSSGLIYSIGPEFTNISHTFREEIIGTGPLLLMTESGFVATDTASEIFSVWSPPVPQIIDDIYSPAAYIGSQGQLANRLLSFDATWPRTLHTLLGPAAIGIELHLKEFDLSPVLVADDIGENGQLNRPLHSFIDPNSIMSLTGGAISYGSTAISTGSLPSPPIKVHFDIDTLRIVVIPEPATIVLLLFTMLAAGAGRRTNG